MFDPRFLSQIISFIFITFFHYIEDIIQFWATMNTKINFLELCSRSENSVYSNILHKKQNITNNNVTTTLYTILPPPQSRFDSFLLRFLSIFHKKWELPPTNTFPTTQTLIFSDCNLLLVDNLKALQQFVDYFSQSSIVFFLSLAFVQLIKSIFKNRGY